MGRRRDRLVVTQSRRDGWEGALNVSSNRPGEVRPRSRKFATEQAWTGFAMREDAARIIRRIRRPCALPHASSGVCWPWKRRHLGQVGLVVDQAGYFPENQKNGGIRHEHL